MEFGIQTRGDWEFILTAAKWAEQRGLAAVALPDHYLHRGNAPEMPAWDHLVHLAALARETTTPDLVCLVSPVTFRHPAVLYKMGVTLDEISGGRFVLGLGAGWMDEEFELFGLPYPDLKTRMEMYEEAMAYIKAAMTPGSGGFDGKHYQLADFSPNPVPANLRLMGGGAGKPKARRIVALYGDEYNLYGTHPEKYAEIRELTRQEAADAGRDPDEITWTSAGPGIAAKKEPDYKRMLDKLAEITDRSPEEIETVYEERQIPHGSGSKASEMIAALEEAGCERYYSQVFVNEDDPSDFGLIFDAYQP